MYISIYFTENSVKLIKEVLFVFETCNFILVCNLLLSSPIPHTYYHPW